MKKLYLLVLLTLFGAATVNATHLMGGQITYVMMDQALPIDSIKVRLSLYRDCSPTSTTLPTATSLSVNGCSPSFVHLQLLPGSGNEITPLCPSWTSPCQGGATTLVPLGFEEYIYEGWYLPNTNCTNPVEFFFSLCCRNSDITMGAADDNFYLKTTLMPTLNNSPQFLNKPVIFGYVGQPFQFSFAASDPDGDSLAFSLKPAMVSNTNTVSYDPPFTPFQPFDSLTTFDNTTGVATIYPASTQIGVIAAEVKEYRNGTLVGIVERDVQIIILPTTQNTLPYISGVNGTSVYHIYANAGMPVNFHAEMSESDSGQTVSGLWQSGINASTSISNDTAFFSWTPDTSHVQFAPHLVTLTASDNNCPVQGSSIAVYKIFVVNPDTSAVWPGDTDNDFDADVYDVLPLTIAAGASGLVRPGASTNWIGQYAPTWSQNFFNGLNYKYADADGNGAIDTNDALVIALNYGLTHSKKGAAAATDATGDLNISFVGDTLQAGSWHTAEITLGDAFNPKTIYGTAFKVDFDPGVIDASSITFKPQNGWFGTHGIDVFTFEKDEGNGLFALAISRINGQNITGYGKLGELKFKLVEEPASFQTGLSITGINAIENTGVEIELTGGSETTDVNTTSGLPGTTEAHFTIYPNPADNLVTVHINRNGGYISIVDLQGKTIAVKEITSPEVTFNTTELPAGVYFVQYENEGQQVTQKLMIGR